MAYNILEADDSTNIEIEQPLINISGVQNCFSQVFKVRKIQNQNNMNSFLLNQSRKSQLANFESKGTLM